MNSEEYIESLMHDAEDYANFVNNHWSQDLLDKPGALVAVIETKISRAVLSERRRIVERVKAYAGDIHFIGVWAVIDIIEGENE